MASTVTYKLKKLLAQELFNDIEDSASAIYYAGIGRSQEWDNASDSAPTPTVSEREQRNALLNIQSVKRITDYSFVIPRYNWSTGTTYSSYDDNSTGYPTNAYYVLTDQNQVYACIQTPKNSDGAVQPSTVKPTGTTNKAFTTADGYVWKFLYSLGALDATKFLAANYIPVKFFDSAQITGVSTAQELQQANISNAAVGGQILNIIVTANGTGYTSDPTVTIVGDGTSASATVSARSGNQINAITMDDDSASLGSGYTKAYVKITGGGGTGAKARAVIGPKLGLGYDPRDELRSTALMFNTKPNGLEGGDFIIDNDFRQVTLLKNPLIADSDASYTGATGMVLRKLTLNSGHSGFAEDQVVIGGTSGAKGIIDYLDDSDHIYYHGVESDGYFVSFNAGESLTSAGGGTGVLSTDSAQDVEPLSGDVLYIDNRAAIVRSTSQTEDLKIVIQI